MPTLNRSELARFLSEHLTAAAVMVSINDPIDPNQRVRDAYHHLEENKVRPCAGQRRPASGPVQSSCRQSGGHDAVAARL
jgi:hypothetical protein